MPNAALLQRLHIALIDDEGAWQTLQDGLIACGHDVQRIPALVDPGPLVASARPDVVLLAAEAPRVEGQSASARWRQCLQALGRSLPVVVLAETADSGVIEAALGDGASDVVDRHAQATLLAARLTSLAEAARMRAALSAQPWGRDPLTGLLDRLGFIDAAQASAGALGGRVSQPLFLLLIDLDRFKRINDALGAAAGDEVLRQVSERLCRSLEPLPEALISRTAGDEFAVLLSGLKQVQAAQAVAELVLDELHRPMRCGAVECMVGVSIGLAADEPGGVLDAASIGSLLSRAARAAAQAKAAGGRGVIQAAASTPAAGLHRLSLESDLQRALARGEMRLHYQPIVDPLRRSLTGIEALARWQRADMLVYPGEFIPVAEETGVVFDLGEWAVGEALHQVRVWRDAGIDVPTVSVNIHPRHLEREQLTMAVVDALHHSGLQAGTLQLEVTETGVMSDVEVAIASLQRLRGLGVRLALDDFGTGHSSLAWLARLPIDTLKIDRSFIRALGRSEPDEAVVRSIMALAHSLGLATVAEGVETATQFDSLHSLGCASMQGYLYARPMPAHELAQWWRSFQSGAQPQAHEPGSAQAGGRARGAGAPH